MQRHPIRKNIRLPRPVYNQGHAFSITIATHGKHPWFRLHPDLCKAWIPIIRESASALKIKIFAWCMMPDHVHFLLQGQGVVDFIRQFKGKLTPHARAVEPGRKLWQRSFYDQALRKEESLNDVARYIWENPVRAKIVEKLEDYEWSGSGVWTDWRSFYGHGWRYILNSGDLFYWLIYRFFKSKIEKKSHHSIQNPKSKTPACPLPCPVVLWGRLVGAKPQARRAKPQAQRAEQKARRAKTGTSEPRTPACPA